LPVAELRRLAGAGAAAAARRVSVSLTPNDHWWRRRTRVETTVIGMAVDGGGRVVISSVDCRMLAPRRLAFVARQLGGDGTTEQPVLGNYSSVVLSLIHYNTEVL